MFKTATPFFIRAITPVHAGSGNDLGIVDLPIQREGHTGFPKIESSTLKGSIRDAFELKANGNESEEIKIHLIFGYDGTNASQNVKKFFEQDLDFTQFSSAIAFADARILLFPVKSLKGVFAYVTCPQVLKRLKEDLKMALLTDKIEINGKEFKAESYKVEDEGKALVPNENKLIVQGNQVVLEEYLFEVEKKQEVSELAQILSRLTGVEEDSLKERLIVLPDDDFADFVKLSTEVITRIKINNETGTVDQGALFTEEYLPAETVMYSIAFFSPLFIPEEKREELKKKIGNEFDFSEKTPKTFFGNISKILQIGGNETIGKGFIEVNLFNSKEENKNGN
ncbi:type III-B CRISPR module RAMP protein Cmr4 [Persephonella sp. KM09-Lau-8]|uniref:type III-B CRISPR module RAMP protein Cmr4 n=1 Tax=Persephonella sp. KM09-Lau-8 TaxID=1158345 RepID=UPI00068A291B|nr:type III-B CRISPR module RAMP protein Cmr4 [Persephonella sp. KM09-Lau-8]